MARNFETLAEPVVAAVDESIAQTVPEIKHHVDQYGLLLGETFEPAYDFIARGGKRLRALLVEAAGRSDEDGLTSFEERIKLATAVEFFHAHILIFDDMQDESETRREGPTVHVGIQHLFPSLREEEAIELGKKLAINEAIYFDAVKSDLVDKLKVPDSQKYLIRREFDQTKKETVIGQHLDILSPLNVEKVSEKDIYRVMDQKTGKYTISNPIILGLILRGVRINDDMRQAIWQFSRNAGRAFQIYDDVLPLVPENSGKDDTSDFEERKVTLPVYFVLTDPRYRSKMLELLGSKTQSREEFNEYVEILKKSGSIDKALEVALGYTKKADKAGSEFPKEIESEGIQVVRMLPAYIRNRIVQNGR